MPGGRRLKPPCMYRLESMAGVMAPLPPLVAPPPMLPGRPANGLRPPVPPSPLIKVNGFIISWLFRPPFSSAVQKYV